jgi:hypothetical protein
VTFRLELRLFRAGQKVTLEGWGGRGEYWGFGEEQILRWRTLWNTGSQAVIGKAVVMLSLANSGNGPAWY